MWTYSGSVQVRVRDLIPRPQVVEHSLQLDQRDHEPSTLFNLL